MIEIRGYLMKKGFLGREKLIDSKAVIFTSRTANDLGQAVLEAVAAGADLRGAQLHGLRLPGGDLRNARMENAQLVGAHLPGADLSGSVIGNLEGADLRGANLRGAHPRVLRKADLRDADLAGVTLGCNHTAIDWIGGALLDGANLSGAHIYAHCLRVVDLTRCRGLADLDVRTNSAPLGGLAFGVGYTESNLEAVQRARGRAT